MARLSARCYSVVMRIEQQDMTAAAPSAMPIYAAMAIAVLFLIAGGLWAVFGGDVFARIGSAAWALCF